MNFIMIKKLYGQINGGRGLNGRVNSWLRLFKFISTYNRFDSCALANLHCWHLKVR